MAHLLWLTGGKIKYDYSELMKAVAVWVPDSLVQSFADDLLVDHMGKDVSIWGYYGIDSLSEVDGVATTQD